MSEPPAARIYLDDDEVGIYIEDGLVQIVWYDYQGIETFPVSMMGMIGKVMTELAHQTEEEQ